MEEHQGEISQQYNWRKRASSSAKTQSEAIRKARALKFDSDVRWAYDNALPIRVIACGGIMRDANDPNSRASRVTKRLLDPISWTVTRYDTKTGLCTLTRGALPVPGIQSGADAELNAFEGEARRRFIIHRARERELRAAKLAQTLRASGGRLLCEVPNCGFDFEERYGRLGVGYAHVHHLVPLAEMPITGQKVSLDDLAVVCANCHAMIHVGGKCRPLHSLIPLRK